MSVLDEIGQLILAIMAAVHELRRVARVGIIMVPSCYIICSERTRLLDPTVITVSSSEFLLLYT
jgi:hypothetical protein